MKHDNRIPRLSKDDLFWLASGAIQHHLDYLASLITNAASNKDSIAYCVTKIRKFARIAEIDLAAYIDEYTRRDGLPFLNGPRVRRTLYDVLDLSVPLGDQAPVSVLEEYPANSPAEAVSIYLQHLAPIRSPVAIVFHQGVATVRRLDVTDIQIVDGRMVAADVPGRIVAVF